MQLGMGETGETGSFGSWITFLRVPETTSFQRENVHHLPVTGTI